MDLEEVEPLVDGLGQPELVREHVDGPNAAVSDGPVPVSNVVVDGVIGEHGPGGLAVVRLVESSLDSGQACAEPGAENRFHSKSLVGSR